MQICYLSKAWPTHARKIATFFGEREIKFQIEFWNLASLSLELADEYTEQGHLSR